MIMGRSGKRARMFERFKNCYHCGRDLIIESDDPNNPALATLQNKYSFFDRERHQQTYDHKDYRYFLVCLDCSRKMNKEREEDVPLELRRDLAHSYPLLDLEGFRAELTKDDNGKIIFVPSDNGRWWVTEYETPFLPTPVTENE